ncbi:hypothetical protein [Actinoplanes sp. N902-109]|uniref:hypothetical protein n=1 Tax=Actinoplanes sp. (strain N902-109) TaxID=649831 RepID=UPI00032962D5|nr:hypothetical protein [Actinoplanes sp. N902-109]AGL15043.1 hypothetical protein L083_1533 [Actinoplanes sp. N902-109]
MRLTLLAVLILALAGCANGDPAAAPAPASSDVVVRTSPPAPAEPSADAPQPGASQTTISGTISAGVEPNCIVLDKYLLILRDAEQKSIARAGATVTVVGTPQPGMMTTCMQGTPFIVASVRAK